MQVPHEVAPVPVRQPVLLVVKVVKVVRVVRIAPLVIKQAANNRALLASTPMLALAHARAVCKPAQPKVIRLTPNDNGMICDLCFVEGRIKIARSTFVLAIFGEGFGYVCRYVCP